MLFRLRTCRPLRLTTPFWLCVTSIFLFLIYTFGLRQPDPYRSSFFFGGRTRWVVDPGAGCPPLAATRPQSNKAGSAAVLTPAELLCRPLASDLTAVPKLLHQTWKSTELPAKFERWSSECRKQHPDWEWVLWTDDDNLALVRKYFPWMEDTFLSLPGTIYRADLARNMYMYMFGGVYADLDTECLRPTTAAFDEYNIPVAGGPVNSSAPQMTVFGRMGTDAAFDSSIPNAWMASTPGHPFFLLPLASARAEVAKSRSTIQKPWYDWPSAEQLTGPTALWNQLTRFETRGLSREAAGLAGVSPFSGVSRSTKNEVVMLPEQWVYPFSWNMAPEVNSVCSAERESFDASRCQELLKVREKGSISITYWSHTHRGKGSDAKNIDLVSHD